MLVCWANFPREVEVVDYDDSRGWLHKINSSENLNERVEKTGAMFC